MSTEIHHTYTSIIRGFHRASIERAAASWFVKVMQDIVSFIIYEQKGWFFTSSLHKFQSVNNCSIPYMTK